MNIENQEVQSSRPVQGEPSDFFPTSKGVKWVYEIKIGNVKPLNYREIRWPLGDKRAMKICRRGFYLNLARDSRREKFMLEVKVKGSATQQGPLKFPMGAELDIKRDELGIFGDAKRAFWAITSSGPFEVFEVVIYSPDIYHGPRDPWGGWGQEEGYSMRILYFGGKPGTAIGLGTKPKERLLFKGVDTQVPDNEGAELLHFLRKVEPAEKKEGEDQNDIDKGFSEDMWFAREKGLVRLEQKVDGKTSMIWNLVQFSNR